MMQAPLPASPRALVIDDHPDVRRQLREALHREGWEATSAPRTEFGLILATSALPDLVFLDVDGPPYQAEAMATGLRIHFGPNLPIVALSAVLQPQAAPWIAPVGTLKKPVDMDGLHDQLRYAVARLERLTGSIA